MSLNLRSSPFENESEQPTVSRCEERNREGTENFRSVCGARLKWTTCPQQQLGQGRVAVPPRLAMP
eukprot:4020600-Amphidinium_carterae.1